ncbi:uncharacterized protein LOC107611532 [Arachis ipaensis]|uniref:uncharacterized protein LOC107611532 n=1 Tax=Arachis ipaensis TaxID=130454 RepID=UPI0007AF98C3|nr:uncharacterized protein LOC107611532 [Arachis ipaensis]XP_025670581.1 uncharacterized protein LOC112770441 [Arachis hypogaea]
MHAPEFSEYVNTAPAVVAAGEFVVGIEFNSREAVIASVKEYTIRRGVDYRYCWAIRRYNGSHTCTRSTISQDHAKLDSDTIAEAIKPLVEADPSIKVKFVIAEVQLKFNYTISYRKAWLAKQKAVEKIFGGWESSYEALPTWFEAMVAKEPSAADEYKTAYGYRGGELVEDLRILTRVFWAFYPCIKAFRSCKPVVQIDGTHLYEKYKGALLVAVSQDGNGNIVPLAFAIVEGETANAWYFFLSHLRTHVVNRDGVSLISDRHESIISAVGRSNGAWEYPRAIHMFCIRHIASNFLRSFKAPLLQRLIVNIGYSRTMREFDMRYQRLCERGEAYKQWLDRIPRQQYALAYDGGHCWGHMKTNLVECINGALKGACNLPVTAFVKATFYRLNALFTRKRSEVEARISAGQLFSEYATQKIMSNQRSAGIHRQRPYCRIRIQAHTRSNARGPSMSLQSYLDARHNDRYMCLCQAEPQLNL